MIFQDPMTSLDPTMKIGQQIAEPLMKHKGASKKEAWAKALEMMKAVGIPHAEERINQYPHQFSGGMRQRIAYLFLGANGSPFGGSSKSGGVPGIDSKVSL